jgi:hypothetical protein
VLSSDVVLALAPRRTYERLLRQPPAGGRFAALKRLVFLAVLIGTLLAICTTGRVTVRLAASTTLCWMIVPAVQAAAGAALIASSRRREIGMARALDLFFAGHVPWSLWLLGLAAWAGLAGPPRPVVKSTALVPAAWTLVILCAFCQSVLQTDRRGALVRTAAHQALIWGVALAFVLFNVGGWARLAGILGR